MTRYVSGWTAMFAWSVMMAIVWALFVPKGLSVGTFTMLTLTGPLLLLAGSVLWRAQQPSASSRRGQRAELEAGERATTEGRIPG